MQEDVQVSVPNATQFGVQLDVHPQEVSSRLALGICIDVESGLLIGDISSFGGLVVWEVTTRWKEDRRIITIKMSVILNELRDCKKLVVSFWELGND